MPDVKISVAGRDYFVACKPGEESRLLELADMVHASAMEAGGGSPGVNETHMLLFSALLLADKLHDQSGTDVAATARAADALEELATRLENLALRLEN